MTGIRISLFTNDDKIVLFFRSFKVTQVQKTRKFYTIKFLVQIISQVFSRSIHHELKDFSKNINQRRTGKSQLMKRMRFKSLSVQKLNLSDRSLNCKI